MSFGSPLFLLALLAIPPIAVAYAVSERQRRKQESVWGTPALLTNLVTRPSGVARHLPVALLLVGITFLLVGFARPQVAYTSTKKVATIVVVVDTSGSMDANDVKPTRLRAARNLVTAFVGRLPAADRVALITFSDSAAVRVPLTTNHAAIGAAIPLEAKDEGTALGSGLAAALAVIAKSGASTATTKGGPSPAAVLLLSDGAQNVKGPASPQAVAIRAKIAKVPITAVLLGTANGVVHQQLPGTKYSERLAVPADPTTLKAIAGTSGGHFLQGADPETLVADYAHLGSHALAQRHRREIADVAAGLGLLLAVAGVVWSSLSLSRLP